MLKTLQLARPVSLSLTKMKRDYNLDLGFPEKSCIETAQRVAFSWRPVDRVAREIRKITYNPELMLSRNSEGIHFCNNRINEIIDGVNGLVDDQKHPLVIEIKKVVISYYKTMEMMNGIVTDSTNMPHLS